MNNMNYVSSEGRRFAYSEGVQFDKINDESQRNYERRGRDSDCRPRRDSMSWRRRRRKRSRSVQNHISNSERRTSPFGNGSRDKFASASSNLAKLKDLYSDATSKKEEAGYEKLSKDNSTEEVIRLGGSSWK